MESLVSEYDVEQTENDRALLLDYLRGLSTAEVATLVASLAGDTNEPTDEDYAGAPTVGGIRMLLDI